jgi:endonuclease-3
MLCKGEEVFKKLSKSYNIEPHEFVAYDVWLSSRDPFKVLIATVLSQNTTDKSTYKSFKTLDEKVGVKVTALAEADVGLIAECIRYSGLNNSKARRLKEISNIILNLYEGNIWNIIDKPPKEAKELLKSLPGVGDKTADVVLLTCKGYEEFPVDTHIKRISLRLNIASKGDSYSDISGKLISVFRDTDLLKAHHLLITHGRRTCKANKPLCHTCPINYCCEFYRGKNREGGN